MVELDWDNVPKDLCPVCKTDKYLSPEIQFKINPECYHKICDSCVDRIFSLGPSPCPYPNCEKILRKNKFKTQIFDDLGVEKECDIRRRVLTVYNKKENDFTDSEKYNEYLEEIEDIVYKLLHREDIEETEERLKQYSIKNKQSIELNNARKEQEYEKFIRLQKLERQYKSERNRLNREIIKEDTNLKNLSKVAVIDQLQKSSSDKDPEVILENIRSSVLKKTSKCKHELQELEEKYIKQKEAIQKNIHPNKKEKDETSKIPFTPFNGDRMLELPFQFNKDYYKDPYLLKLVDDVQYSAAGYNINYYFERALNDAFTGLDCFIEEEKLAL